MMAKEVSCGGTCDLVETFVHGLFCLCVDAFLWHMREVLSSEAKLEYAKKTRPWPFLILCM